MNKVMLRLRICYWWGAILDGVMAVLMLSPRWFARVIAGGAARGAAFGEGLRYGAPLMIGWTLLLLWANRRPVERKDILLLTLPVVGGYVLLQAYEVWTGLAPLAAAVPLWASQLVLVALYVYSYLTAPDVSATTVKL